MHIQCAHAPTRSGGIGFGRLQAAHCAWRRRWWWPSHCGSWSWGRVLFPVRGWRLAARREGGRERGTCKNVHLWLKARIPAARNGPSAAPGHECRGKMMQSWRACRGGVRQHCRAHAETPTQPKRKKQVLEVDSGLGQPYRGRGPSARRKGGGSVHAAPAHDANAPRGSSTARSGRRSARRACLQPCAWQYRARAHGGRVQQQAGRRCAAPQSQACVYLSQPLVPLSTWRRLAWRAQLPQRLPPSLCARPLQCHAAGRAASGLRVQHMYLQCSILIGLRIGMYM